jgi:dihydrofolate reductase
MREVCYFVACSLDGFIAGPDASIDWLFTDGDYGYADFYREVDCLLVGRQTFETALSFGEYPYAGKRVCVFTRGGFRSPVTEAEVVQADPASFVASLKQFPGGRIWLVGGGELAGALAQARLVDELVVSVHPVTLGRGVPLFQPHDGRGHWEVTRTLGYPTGLVQTTYRLRD